MKFSTWMKTKGWTISAFAVAHGMSKATVYRLKVRAHMPTLETFSRISAITDGAVKLRDVRPERGKK